MASFVRTDIFNVSSLMLPKRSLNCGCSLRSMTFPKSEISASTGSSANFSMSPTSGLPILKVVFLQEQHGAVYGIAVKIWHLDDGNAFVLAFTESIDVENFVDGGYMNAEIQQYIFTYIRIQNIYCLKVFGGLE